MDRRSIISMAPSVIDEWSTLDLTRCVDGGYILNPSRSVAIVGSSYILAEADSSGDSEGIVTISAIVAGAAPLVTDQVAVHAGLPDDRRFVGMGFEFTVDLPEALKPFPPTLATIELTIEYQLPSMGLARLVDKRIEMLLSSETRAQGKILWLQGNDSSVLESASLGAGLVGSQPYAGLVTTITWATVPAIGGVTLLMSQKPVIATVLARAAASYDPTNSMHLSRRTEHGTLT